MKRTFELWMTLLVAGILVLGVIQVAIAASFVSLDWSATVTTPTSSLYGTMMAQDAADNIFVTGSVMSDRGTYTLTVTNITKTGYTFDPTNSVLSKSITK